MARARGASPPPPSRWHRPPVATIRRTAGGEPPRDRSARTGRPQRAARRGPPPGLGLAEAPYYPRRAGKPTGSCGGVPADGSRSPLAPHCPVGQGGSSGAGAVRPWTRHTASVVRDPAGGHRGPGRQPPRARGNGSAGRPWLSGLASPDQSECAPPAGAGAACDDRQPGLRVGPIPGGRGSRRGPGLSRVPATAGPSGAGRAAVAFRPPHGGIRGGDRRRRPGYSPARSDPIPGGRGLPLSVPADRTGSGGQRGPSGRASRPPRPPS